MFCGCLNEFIQAGYVTLLCPRCISYKFFKIINLQKLCGLLKVSSKKLMEHFLC